MAETIGGLIMAAFVAIVLIYIGISVFGSHPQATTPTQPVTPATQMTDNFGWAFVIAGIVGVIAVVIALAKMFGS